MAIDHKLLEKIEAFKGFSENQLAKVKNLCAEVVFNENDRLFAEGDPATHLWLVIDGRVDLRFEIPVRQFATAEQTVFTVKVSTQKPMAETLGWSCFVSPYRMRLSAYCDSPACRIVKGGENLCHFQRSKTIPVSAVYQPAFLNLLPLFFLKMNFLWIFFFCLWYAPRNSVSAPGQFRRS